MYSAFKENLRVVDSRSLVEKVESQLVELLQQQKLKVGDEIPREADLAKLLGVSRTVAREALLRLRVLGLIESKKKKGSFITSPDLFGNLGKNMNPYILDQQTLRNIFEIRLVLEVGMSDFIFQRITKSDIDELKEIVKNEPAATEDFLFNADHEIAFHGKLYQISGNEALKKFQDLLLPIFNYVHNSGLLKNRAVTKRFVSHRGLVDILETGSPELFRNAMRSHLEPHFARLFE